MTTGIKGKTALVCASSKGLGKGCAMALAGQGVNLIINARNIDVLEATAKEISSMHDVSVTPVAADITTVEGRSTVLAQCGDLDILVTNAGGPPAGDFRDWSRDDWIGAIDANMLTPIELIKSTIDGMIDRKFGRIVNITSASVKSPYPALGMSNGARAGLTGFVSGLARQVSKHNVTINNLLPGTHDTDRIRQLATGRAERENKDIEEILESMKAGECAKRFGTAEEFGAACAFFCSDNAGYITGQNLMIDGGAYTGTF